MCIANSFWSHALIVQSPAKTCLLDHMPTSLRKQYSDALLSLISATVNAPLSTGTVPKQFKRQSVYRKDHSAETAVLSVLDCLLEKADERPLMSLWLLCWTSTQHSTCLIIPFF